METRNILVIGAGQIGSRHLQALKRIKMPLRITVVDPSARSLIIAKNGFEEVPLGKAVHSVKYLDSMPSGQNIDLAIIATTSDVRADAIKDVLKNNRVHYFILEKILFNKKRDYYEIENIFSKSKTKAWVNCARRIWPIYSTIRNELDSQPVSIRTTMGQWDLACNVIHFLDLAAHIAADTNFSVDTSRLDKKLLSSKRKGFVEFRGTLSADFKNGSHCEFISYPSGDAPFVLEIFNDKSRYIIQETDKKAYISRAKNNWRWKDTSFKTLLVSETTAVAVENILRSGNCRLTPYKESAKIHLNLLEALRQFLNKIDKKNYSGYPFT